MNKPWYAKAGLVAVVSLGLFGIVSGCGGSAGTADGNGYNYNDNGNSVGDYWQLVTIDGVECVVQTTDDKAVSCNWEKYNASGGSAP